jgi:hypothetical protein
VQPARALFGTAPWWHLSGSSLPLEAMIASSHVRGVKERKGDREKMVAGPLHSMDWGKILKDWEKKLRKRGSGGACIFGFNLLYCEI